MRKRVITVPKDKKAEEALDFDEAKEEQLIELTLEEEEFLFLYQYGIIELINREGGANIDDFEDDSVIGREKISRVIKALGLRATSEDNSRYQLIQNVCRLVWADSTLQIAKRWKGSNSDEYAKALRAQGMYPYVQGNFAMAEQQWLKALAIVRNNGSAYVMNMETVLGDMYSLWGDYTRADSFFTAAVQKMHKHSMSKTDPADFSTLYYRYARHLIRIQRYDDAKMALQEILTLQEKVLGQDSPRLLVTKATLDSVQMLADGTIHP